MKVFISWSGETSKEVAEILRDWLSSVMQKVEPYMSSEDIQKGANWSSSIAQELNDSKYGIICLTKENIAAPWIHFEAGALAKGLSQSFVTPFLFKLKQVDIQGPLTQFQATRFEKKDIKRLLESINTACVERDALTPQVLTSCFEKWWPDLDEKLNSISPETKSEIPSKSKPEDINALLEEILNTVRYSQQLLSSPERLFSDEKLNHILRLNKVRRRDISMEAVEDLRRSHQRIKKFLAQAEQKIIEEKVKGSQSKFDSTFLGPEIKFTWLNDLRVLIDNLEKPVDYLYTELSRLNCDML